MSFFQKQETQKNLQYDDIAFLHFLLTISIISIIFFGYFVWKRLRSANIKSVKNYNKIVATGLYTKQLQNQAKRLKKQKITTSFWIMVAIFGLSILVSVGLIQYIGTHTTQMIGFDPHQILGVAPDATTNQIKKAYRKLALELHPDRNPNNPQAHAKFIMVSKSYECLTDEQKRQNCLKYGNPDGQTSFQVGIGLPKVLITKQNQFIILPVVFTIFLIIIPMIFINWTKSLKARDPSGFDRQNAGTLYPFYRPDFNATFGFYLVTALKQLQTEKRLTQKQKDEFKVFIQANKLIDIKYVFEKMSQSQLYVVHQLFRQMALKQPDVQLCEKLPDLLNSLMLFSLYFARKVNDKKNLLEDSLPITFIGTQHIHMLLQFIRTFYNCSLFNPPVFTHFDYLQIPNQDRQTSYRNPVKNLRQLITNEDRIQQHLSIFPQHHRQNLRRQINDIPIINLEVKIMIGKQQVNEFSVQDFPQFYFKVSKANQTSGYCYMSKFPFLKQQRFYFMMVYGNNLIHFQQIFFEQGKNQFVGKFPYRQVFPRDMKFFAFIYSDCRYGLDFGIQVNFNVYEPTQQEKEAQVQIHRQDKEIEKLPKNGFEKALSLEVENESDNQLSDSQDTQQQQKQSNRQKQSKQNNRQKPKRSMKMERQRGGCHDSCCDH